MIFLLLQSALLLSAAAPPDSSVEPDLQRELQKLVRLKTPKSRKHLARELARRKEISLEEWLAAMGEFGSFEEQPTGTRIEEVALQVGAETEATPIHLHIPESYDLATPAPLLLAFHGTGGSGDYMVPMWSDQADELGMIVIAPSETGANEGYGFSDRERLAALAALRWARLEFNIDEDRVFATGISRGGHIAWDLALRYPGTLAAIAPMIGSPRIQHRHGQNNVRYLENVVDLPIRDLQGKNDHPGMVFNIKFVFERLAELGARDAELHLEPDLGHSFRLSAVDWKVFFGETRRDPLPARVIRTVGSSDELRAFWVEVLETKKPVAENFEVPLTKRWKEADNFEQRLIIQEQANRHTGRLEVRLSGAGRYEAKVSKGIKHFRLLLPQRAFEEGKPVTVSRNGQKIRRRPKASRELLLIEFAERFDRRFLPVAEVRI
jgi:predicted esterase